MIGATKFNTAVAKDSNGNVMGVSMKRLRAMDPYLKYGGSYLGDAKDTKDFKYVTYEEVPKFGPEHKSFMAKLLTA